MTEPGAVGSGAAPSGTMTFLFTDIEGSTQRWDGNRSAMQDALRVHDRLMRETIATNGGHVFKTIGDAFCAAFATPESAAQAALDAQRTLGEADFTAVNGLPVRMALNTGTADERDGDYFGPALNRVARLLALAHGGQILLSSTTAGLVRANPPPHTTLVDLGAHGLKDLEGNAEALALYERVLFSKERAGAPDGPELGEIRENIAALCAMERCAD
jgi:class 3 adenylate cyclase